MKKNYAPLSEREKVVSLGLVKGGRYNAEEENIMGRQKRLERGLAFHGRT